MNEHLLGNRIACKPIRLISMDVDGTLTDGKLSFVDYKGSLLELKSFNVKDGLGIKRWLEVGGMIVIISGRECGITRERVNGLGIDKVFMGVENKAGCLLKVVKDLGLSLGEVACIGDDVNDLQVYDVCALSFAPSDAHEENIAKADVVLKSGGGNGAVREMIDILMCRFYLL